ncbi:putative ferric-chelate reductase 1 homolog isoform X2 [Zootermopsis nevadensis]|uniref:putative ferric-chelate reductase 1 homolog isoform X2 n=1 Tax=Zootermopsis nevadensis TaxID=136037 RepID=UPI000B8E3B2F|nr:putative ferric-chelate reductase 1 homolog isoform X2 [Zootermopsis nevadensis]
MIGAWIGAAGSGILLARYFKQTWAGSRNCGKDQWFAWHRMFMLLTWGLTVAAFVLIFLELKDWSAEDNPHAILGCATTAQAFVQPFGAAFRPHPDSRRRPTFDWLHWLVGNVAHILGTLSGLVEVCQCFTGPCCLNHHQPDDVRQLSKEFCWLVL